MRTAFILLLALAFATIFNVECTTEAFKVNCSSYKKLPPEEQSFCPLMFEPICASDGKTYSNECFFCSEVKQTEDELKFMHFGSC